MRDTTKTTLLTSPLAPMVRQAALRLKPALAYFRQPDMRGVNFEELRVFKSLAKIVRPDDNCLDVGCHVGFFLSEFVRLAPAGRHLAVEPSVRKAYELFHAFPECEILACALAKERGRETFHEYIKFSGFSHLGSSGANTEFHNGDGDFISYEVDVRVLDDIVPTDRKIKALKIDTEGTEEAILRGGASFVERDSPAIVFECGANGPQNQHKQNAESLFRYMTHALGYRVYTPGDFLNGGNFLGFDDFNACRQYPPKARNFIALRS